MALVLTEAPAAEPISVSEAKAFLRVDGDDENALIGSLITTARSLIERTLGLALITQSWSYFLDAWPGSLCVVLPIAPVQSVTAIKLYDSSGTPTALGTASYSADVLSQPARIALQAAAPPVVMRPLNAIEIDFTAGYGDGADAVPSPLRQALLLLVAHWYERREPVTIDGTPLEVPYTVAGLLAPYRRVRL